MTHINHIDEKVSYCVLVDDKREEVRDWVIQLSMDQQVGSQHPSFDVLELETKNLVETLSFVHVKYIT